MGTQLSNHIRDGTRRTGCGDTQAWGHGSLAAEAFARFDPCTIHKFAIGDAVAALELNVFYAKDRRAAADYEQAVFLCREENSGRAVRGNGPERLTPDAAGCSTKCGEGAGPGLQAADAIVDSWGR